MSRSILSVLLLMLSIGIAHASPNCDKAPYGARIETFVRYEKYVRQVIPAHILLRDICQAKFEHRHLAVFRRLLHLSNADIEGMSMSGLSVLALEALRHLTRQPARRPLPRPVGVYAPFECVASANECTYIGPQFTSRSACVAYVNSFNLAYPMRCLFHAQAWQP